MFMAPRIDNISSVQACLTGLIEANPSDGISVAVLFDHEEIGSRSKNGANGNLLSYTLERICNALNISRENFLAKPCTQLLSFFGRCARDTPGAP